MSHNIKYYISANKVDQRQNTLSPMLRFPCNFHLIEGRIVHSLVKRVLEGPTAQDQIVLYAFYSATYMQHLCIIATWARLFKAGLK